MIDSVINKYKGLSIPAKASIWFVICSFLQKGISLITTPIFTRMLTTEEYGTYTLYSSWLSIIYIFITLKLSEAVFNKSMINSEGESRRVTLASFQWLICIIWLFFFVLYFISKSFISRIMDLSENLLLLMLFEILFEATIALWTSFQRFEYRYITLIVVTISISILNPIGSLLFLKLYSSNAVGRVIGIVCSQFIFFIILFFYNIRFTKIKNLTPLWKYAISFNLPLLPHYLSQIILSQSDRIMIANIDGKSNAALYGVAYTIGMLSTMVTQSICNAYVPSLYRKLKEKNINEVASNNLLLMLIVSFVVVLLYCGAPEIILIIGGAKYYEAIKVVYPVACSVFFMFCFSLYANIEYYYSTKKYVMIGSCVAAITNVVLNYVFINMFGYQAAAYTTLICYVIYGFFHIIISDRLISKFDGIKIKTNYKMITSISLILVISSFIIQKTISMPIVRYSFVLLFFILTYINRQKVLGIIKTIRKE